MRVLTLADCRLRKPEMVVRQALQTGCASVAYTYTEPTIFYEFTRDTAVLAKQAGLKNVYVSNGYMTKEVISEMANWLDAANIDIKAFSDDAYRKFTGAHLEPVLEACKALSKCWCMARDYYFAYSGLER